MKVCSFGPVIPSLTTRFHLTKPESWRTSEGAPFTRQGRVQQGYFFPLSDEFTSKMARRFPQLGLAQRSTQPLHPLATLAEDLLVPADWLAEVVELLEDKRQIIFQGPPGTGKTFVARRLAGYFEEQGGGSEIVQFHPSYAYEDFIEGYRPRLLNGQPGFKLVEGPLKRLAARAEEDRFPGEKNAAGGFRHSWSPAASRVQPPPGKMSLRTILRSGRANALRTPYRSPPASPRARTPASSSCGRFRPSRVSTKRRWPTRRLGPR